MRWVEAVYDWCAGVGVYAAGIAYGMPADHAFAAALVFIVANFVSWKFGHARGARVVREVYRKGG